MKYILTEEEVTVPEGGTFILCSQIITFQLMLISRPEKSPLKEKEAPLSEASSTSLSQSKKFNKIRRVLEKLDSKCG